jgi:hypothetical protein
MIRVTFLGAQKPLKLFYFPLSFIKTRKIIKSHKNLDVERKYQVHPTIIAVYYSFLMGNAIYNILL